MIVLILQYMLSSLNIQSGLFHFICLDKSIIDKRSFPFLQCNLSYLISYIDFSRFVLSSFHSLAIGNYDVQRN